MQKRITKLTFSKIPTERKRLQLMQEYQAARTLCYIPFLHRSAITAVLFRRITTGNMSVATLTRLSQAPKKIAKIFKGF